jgi:[NiFe] hydrogenase assembly HybE family chaperone
MSGKPEIEITRKLEAVFNRIFKERMTDMPMVNDNLQVHAIDFQPWQQHYVGVLSTPWFMNLMLLPGEQEDWSEFHELTKRSHVFPSGRYEFITGYEESIGKYQMCSLFSPMFEFADDDSAVETAQIIMQELMNTQNQDEIHVQAQQMEAIWKGEDVPDIETQQATINKTNNPEPERPMISERLQQPLSRRELLRGMFNPDGDKS